MKDTVTSMKWTISLSVIAGLVLSGVLADPVKDALSEFYEYTHPVVVMQGEFVMQDADSATIHIYGEKLRDCKYLQLNAYTLHGGTMQEAFRERITGKPEDGTTKPLGKFDIGYWRVYPKGDADAVLMFVQHDCGNGRITTTKVAEVLLK